MYSSRPLGSLRSPRSWHAALAAAAPAAAVVAAAAPPRRRRLAPAPAADAGRAGDGGARVANQAADRRAREEEGRLEVRGGVGGHGPGDQQPVANTFEPAAHLIGHEQAMATVDQACAAAAALPAINPKRNADQLREAQEQEKRRAAQEERAAKKQRLERLQARRERLGDEAAADGRMTTTRRWTA